MTRFTLPLFLALLVACSDHPGLNGPASTHVQAADYPALVPLSPLLAQQPDMSDDLGTGDLAARAAGLRARAAALRGAIIDPATRARMRAALARHAQ